MWEGVLEMLSKLSVKDTSKELRYACAFSEIYAGLDSKAIILF